MSYLLCGQNSLLIDERIGALLAVNDPSGFGTTLIDVQTSTIESIASACHASPFFGGVRVVVLRQPLVQPRRGDEESSDVEEAPAGRIRWQDLLQVLKATPDSTVVVVTHDGSLAPNHYARKALRELGWTVEQIDIPRGGELLSWVTSRARNRGYTFGPGAAERLLDLLHPSVWQSSASRYDTDTPNPRLIASEIDKLALASVDGVVTQSTIEALVVDRSGYRAFALNDAIFEGRTDRALVELDLMIESGEASERILSQLGGDIAGVSATRFVGEYGSKDVAAAAGISEGRVHSLLRRNFSRSTLGAMAEAVRHADGSVKTGMAPQMSSVITPLVAELSESARTPNRSR